VSRLIRDRHPPGPAMSFHHCCSLPCKSLARDRRRAKCLHNWVMAVPWRYDDEGRRFAPGDVDRRLLEQAMGSIGAGIIGRRMFDVTGGWGAIPRAVAGDRDVGIGGGANVIQHTWPPGWSMSSGCMSPRCCWARASGCSTSSAARRPSWNAVALSSRLMRPTCSSPCAADCRPLGLSQTGSVTGRYRMQRACCANRRSVVRPPGNIWTAVTSQIIMFRNARAEGTRTTQPTGVMMTCGRT
jgi:hypothetical protein